MKSNFCAIKRAFTSLIDGLDDKVHITQVRKND